MALTALQIAAISKALLDHYRNLVEQGKLDSTVVPNKVTVLNEAIKFLDFGGFLDTSNPSTISLAKVGNAIKKLQDSVNLGLTSDVGKLVVDGIMGVRTLSRVNISPKCFNELVEKPSKTKVPEPEDPDVRKIRYFFDALPAVAGPTSSEILFQNGILRWVLEAKIDVQPALTREGANLVVGRRNFGDGRSGTLADAHVGPPNGMVFKFDFDTGEEPWDRETFEYTVAHEFGHVLGVRHQDVDNSGQLMSPLVQPGIIGPQSGDLQALKRRGWELRT